MLCPQNSPRIRIAVSDATGQRSLVELCDRQVYLAHLQTRALYEALGRNLGSSVRPIIQARVKESGSETAMGTPAGDR